MTLQEAIKAVQGKEELWFRPVSWKDLGIAFTIIGEDAYRVPSSKGGRQDMTHDIDELLGEWEVIGREYVIGERLNYGNRTES